jgi:hypothetical protein
VAPFPFKVVVLVPTLREARQLDPPPVEAYLWFWRYYPQFLYRAMAPEAGEDVLREGIRRAPDPRLNHALATELHHWVHYNHHHLS